MIIILLLIGIIKIGEFHNNKIKTKNNTQYEKQKELLNKSFTEKDYVLPTEELLIEIKNNSNIKANADIKVEFYKNKKKIKTRNTSIIGIEKKYTSYVSLSIRNISYDTYKVSSVLSPNIDSTRKILTKKIKIISSKKKDRNIQIEYKNNASQDLDKVELGVLFYNNKNKIIAYQSVIDSDRKASSSNSIKINIPYDNKYNPIKYTKSKIIVLNAYHTKEE